MDRLHTLLRPAIAVDWTRLTVYSYNSLADNAYRLTASPVFCHDNRLLLIIDCCKPPVSKSVFVDNIYIDIIGGNVPQQSIYMAANVYRNIFLLANCRSNMPMYIETYFPSPIVGAIYFFCWAYVYTRLEAIRRHVLSLLPSWCASYVLYHIISYIIGMSWMSLIHEEHYSSTFVVRSICLRTITAYIRSLFLLLVSLLS